MIKSNNVGYLNFENSTSNSIGLDLEVIKFQLPIFLAFIMNCRGLLSHVYNIESKLFDVMNCEFEIVINRMIRSLRTCFVNPLLDQTRTFPRKITPFGNF